MTNDILSKILKLKALAERGGSLQESLAASKKMMELMDRHQVTEQDLADATIQNPDPTVDFCRMGISIPEPRVHNLTLALVLSELGNFKLAVTHDRKTLVFFATSKEAAEMAIELWSLLVSLREVYLKKAYRTARKQGGHTEGFKTSYRNGFTSAIDDLVVKHREERAAEVSFAIVAVDTALTRYFHEYTDNRKAKVSVRNSENFDGLLEGMKKGQELGGALLEQKKRLTGNV